MPTSTQRFNVLFLCTGNSARSIMAESILNHEGGARFAGFSAGSHPAGAVNPHAIVLLEQKGQSVGDLRSKNWDEFEGDNAPTMDFIFTVCDRASREVCPIWPGHPTTAHWGLPDPAAVAGTEAEQRLAFASAYRILRNRIRLFTQLPIGSLDRASLEQKLHQIGVVS